MEQKELILRLIKDDLINTHLIDSLEMIGFYSEGYRLNLSDTIFKVMDIAEEEEELYELYLNKCSEIGKLDIVKNRILLAKSVEETYQFLLILKYSE
jgi:hypothetical protein